MEPICGDIEVEMLSTVFDDLHSDSEEAAKDALLTLGLLLERSSLRREHPDHATEELLGEEWKEVILSDEGRKKIAYSIADYLEAKGGDADPLALWALSKRQTGGAFMLATRVLSRLLALHQKGEEVSRSLLRQALTTAISLSFVELKNIPESDAEINSFHDSVRLIAQLEDKQLSEIAKDYLTHCEAAGIKFRPMKAEKIDLEQGI
jgi:hypothetical protein